MKKYSEMTDAEAKAALVQMCAEAETEWELVRRICTDLKPDFLPFTHWHEGGKLVIIPAPRKPGEAVRFITASSPRSMRVDVPPAVLTTEPLLGLK